MGKTGNAGCLVPFGSIFLIAGLAIFCAIGSDFLEVVETYTWTRTPAQITSIDIEFPRKAPNGRKTGVFELKTHYTYEVDGTEYKSSAFRRKSYRSNDYEDLADDKARLIRGETRFAFVNPDEPDRAVLKRDSLWGGLGLLFPVPFILIGAACIVAGLGWWSEAKPMWEKGKPKEQSNSGKGSSGLGIILFGSVFLFVGLFALKLIVIDPILGSRRAKTWVEVPCIVLWSRVQVHDRDEEADTYSPDIFFEYSINDEVHRSNRYSFSDVSDSNRAAQKAIVKQFPTGKKSTCFVDPATPWHAVLRPNSSGFSLTWILPWPFILVGIFCIRMGLTLKPNDFRTRPSWQNR